MQRNRFNIPYKFRRKHFVFYFNPQNICKAGLLCVLRSPLTTSTHVCVCVCVCLFVSVGLCLMHRAEIASRNALFFLLLSTLFWPVCRFISAKSYSLCVIVFTFPSSTICGTSIVFGCRFSFFCTLFQ